MLAYLSMSISVIALYIAIKNLIATNKELKDWQNKYDELKKLWGEPFV